MELKIQLLSKAKQTGTIILELQDNGTDGFLRLQEVVAEILSQEGNKATTGEPEVVQDAEAIRHLFELLGNQLLLMSRKEAGEPPSFRIQLLEPETSEAMEDSSNKADETSVMADKKVLIVEDNPLNVFVARKLLQKWDVELQEAENGKIALEILRKESFDLILMDLQMPELDGYATTRQIRQLNDRRKATVPVLAISGAAEQEVQNKAYQAGMNDFVLKPFDAEDLRQKLLKYFGEDSSRSK